MEPKHITTIVSTSMGEHKAKDSRFLAYAYPLSRADDLKPILQTLREEHHKAVHWCYAYRLGHEGTQFRANDDGEPSGSAGMPILRQIDSAGLTDLVVVVVRYFGGTLLVAVSYPHLTLPPLCIVSFSLVYLSCHKFILISSSSFFR